MRENTRYRNSTRGKSTDHDLFFFFFFFFKSALNRCNEKIIGSHAQAFVHLRQFVQLRLAQKVEDSDMMVMACVFLVSLKVALLTKGMHPPKENPVSKAPLRVSRLHWFG